MPRQSTLDKLHPNRFYKVQATLKYQHIANDKITAIIEQDNIQSKVSIPKEGVILQQGNSYIFQKCFQSLNGWLYVKNPSQTVHQKQGQIQNQSNKISLIDIYTNEQLFLNHYITIDLKVLEIGEKQKIKKNGKELTLYKLKCFADNLLIDLTVWEHQIKQKELNYKILTFQGFKVHRLTSQTIGLTSTVYSKIYEPDLSLMNALRNISKRFNYNKRELYQDLTSIYNVRSIDEILQICQLFHKNYSIFSAKINQIQEQTYEGCSKCKKKIEGQGCYQCGKKIKKIEYKYLRIGVEDSKGMLECVVFDENIQSELQQRHKDEQIVLYLTSCTKINPETNQKYLSHVITQIDLSHVIKQTNRNQNQLHPLINLK